MTSPFTLHFTAGKTEQGKLLRDFLTEMNISRTALTDIKYHGGKLLINGEEKTVRYVLQEKDIISVQFPLEERNPHVKGEHIALSIVYEDDYILVVEKPAGMSTIPSREHPVGTLANALVYYYAQTGHIGAVHFVTRLDHDTSGLVLVAKHRYTHHLCSLAQEQSAIIKKYLALINGTLISAEGQIDQPIARVNDSIIKREVRTDGQPATTRYRTLYTFPYENQTYSLIQLQLLTGRTHQIRVHMEWLGHPLLGDRLYGGDCTHINRQALHCSELQFLHPITGELLTLNSIPPKDMQRLLPASVVAICDKTNMKK